MNDYIIWTSKEKFEKKNKQFPILLNRAVEPLNWELN